MNKVFQGFEFIFSYVNALIILNKVDWNDHGDKLIITINIFMGIIIIDGPEIYLF